jgi:hypothetical protein
MTYVAHITVPVVFHADDDDAARVILEQLRCHLAGVSVRFDGIPDSAGPEVSDYPDASARGRGLRVSTAAWSFVDYGCGHSTPVCGGNRTLLTPCRSCQSDSGQEPTKGTQTMHCEYFDDSDGGHAYQHAACSNPVVGSSLRPPCAYSTSSPTRVTTRSTLAITGQLWPSRQRLHAHSHTSTEEGTHS